MPNSEADEKDEREAFEKMTLNFRLSRLVIPPLKIQQGEKQMKRIATTILRSFARVFGVSALLAFATVSTALAEYISKTFEFGEGTQQPRSHVRTFPIPCGTEGGVAAVVKFRREGPSNAQGDIPILIELRAPDTGPDQEGPIARTESAMAKTSEQTVVKYANEGTAPFKVYGTARIDYDGGEIITGYKSPNFISKGSSKTVNFGDSGGLEQGRIEMTSDWFHSLLDTGILRGPNPIKLRFELIDPSGTVVKTVEAYSGDEARSELPKFKLIYQVANCTPGQWKLKITNLNPNDDAGGGVLPKKVKFTPGCP